jgi:hypothetical protein
VLNLQTTTAKQANYLANASNNLSAQQQAAMTTNAATALDTSNKLKQAIGQLDMTKYGYDVQSSIGILDYLANLAQTAGGIIDSENNLTGTKYNADQNLAGTVYNADYGYGGSKNPSYAQASQPPVYNYNYGSSGGSGGGGGYSGGGSSGGSSDTGSDTGSSQNTSDQSGSPVSLSYSNATIQQQSDGSWADSTWDADGKPTKITGLNDTQKTAVIMEGDPDVLNEGYQRGVWGNDVQNGDTVTVNGETYTYSSIRHLWIDPNGSAWGARNLKMYKDRLDKEAADAAKNTDYDPQNPTPPRAGWTTTMQPGYEWKELDDHGNNWYGPKGE